MTIRVLYISYTGLLDPLGQSQVLQYVLGLAQTQRMILLTFEKPELTADRSNVQRLQARCGAAGVDWHPLVWHNRPGIPATLYDVVQGIRHATRLARREGAQIVHCRSYIGSMIGLAVKRRTGAKLIFDMRGFWPDERVDGGSWRRDGWVYRAFKQVERRLFLGADHVVSLTQAGRREIMALDYLRGRMPSVTVIPTCTNLTLFRPVDAPKTGFTLGYVGSVGSWYLFRDVARAVALLFASDPDARFLVINKGGHARIRDDLTKAGVDLARVEIRAADFADVAGQIGRMDAGIFFVRPLWSKRASSPTRLGEFLACGKPCLANAGVGDVAEDLQETGTGVTLPQGADGEMDTSGLAEALIHLRRLAATPGMSGQCRAAAEARFSLDTGVAAYAEIYAGLASRDVAT